MGGNIRMQLTFFIGQKIKCPGRSIYLNHAGVCAACFKCELGPDAAPISPDERDGGDHFRWHPPLPSPLTLCGG